jgi:hypothetical protein
MIPKCRRGTLERSLDFDELERKSAINPRRDKLRSGVSSTEPRLAIGRSLDVFAGRPARQTVAMTRSSSLPTGAELRWSGAAGSWEEAEL